MEPVSPSTFKCISKQWSCGTFAAGVQSVEAEAGNATLEIEEEELERQIEDSCVTILPVPM